ncbi:MAG: phosphonate metabolism protein/1,5-bisphosphokinase (PRPP-forming) PhnN [Pseudomonadota bacterium]
MRRGTFIAVVGPSGAGKDTLMNAALAQRPDLTAARRIIAPPRPQLGEAFEAVSDAAFDGLRDEGAFLLHWKAHGHRYAIHRRVEEALDAGRHVVANCSRSVINEARSRFDPFLVLHVTAPVEIRAARLAGRGRESAEDIRERLENTPTQEPSGADVCIIENGRSLAAGVMAFTAALPRTVASASSAPVSVR